MKPLTRVVLLEEKRMLRESLSLIVRGDPALELLGSHSELEEARSACQLDRPDVILVDLDLASGGSIQALQTLKESAPGASLLVITDEGDEKFLSSAESIGAAGLFSKSQPSEDLLDLIHRVAAGEVVSSVSVAASGATRSEREELPPEDPGEEGRLVAMLTPRERDVLGAMAEGKPTSTVAEALGISPLTVKAHVKSILAKLGVHSQIEAVMVGLRQGVGEQAQREENG